MSKLSGKELAQEFESFVNGGSEDSVNEFVTGFMRMHNTLQQKSFGALLKVVVAMADAPYVDGRNEASQVKARYMVEGIKVGTVKELKLNDAYYWVGDKAKDWVYGENFNVATLPLI